MRNVVFTAGPLPLNCVFHPRGSVHANNERVNGYRVAVFAARATGSLISAGDAGGGPSGPVFAVSLVRLSTLTSDTPAQAASEPEPFLINLKTTNAAEGIAVPVNPKLDTFAALAERLRAQTPPAQTQSYPATREQPQGSYIDDPTRVSKASSRRTPTGAEADGEAAGAVSTGTLWGVVEPCWRNLGFRGQEAVSLEVVVDWRGALQGPPKVMRDASARLTEPRLKSEANALAALAACLPRGGARAGRYELKFPATR